MKFKLAKPNSSNRETSYLLLGILYISFCYLLVNYTTYVSFLGMLAFGGTLGFGVIFLLIPHFARAKKISERTMRSITPTLVVISELPAFVTMFFDLRYNAFVYLLLVPYFPMFLAALIPILGIYFVGKNLKGEIKKRPYLLQAVLIIFISIVTFIAVNEILGQIGWPGTDEMAFDLYAAQLFYQGVNPYLASMLHTLLFYKLEPSTFVNGSCVCKLGYPPLSFLPLVVMPALGIASLQPIVYLMVLFTVFAAYIVYRKSNNNSATLAILFAFFLFTFITRPGGAMKYLAVSVFLFLAYLERKRTYVQGAFLGLAAATHQLAWVAIPFFYILALNERGKEQAFRVVLASVGVFLLLSAYFIVQSPQGFVSGLLYYSVHEIQSQGPTLIGPLFQLGLQTSSVYLYSSIVMLLFYACAIALFYLYPDSLKPMLAVAPWAIFFLSPVNESGYFLPFIPLLLAIEYADRKMVRDRVKDKGHIMLAAFLFVITSLILLVLLLIFGR